MADTWFKLVTCGHCGNISHMKIVGNINDTHEYRDPNYGMVDVHGTTYSVLQCPSCSKVNIVTYYWHDGIESNDEIKYEILFPKNQNEPVGLPENILKAYRAAEKVKTIDVNAYVILLRRLLEMVCIERGAKGKSLAEMLNDLSDRGEIPQKLVKVVKGLKDFGNIGAHARSGELSENEIPIATALAVAILEYIYSAPHLAALAEAKLNFIRNGNQGQNP